MQTLTALVTGASEGLGKAFALELAAKNINLVLVALPDTGLQYLCAYIRKNYNVQACYYEMDLTQTEAYINLFETLRKKGILLNVLINNAGLGNWAWFENQPLHFYKKQIELNTITPVLITRLFLSQVQKNERSYILNVGSLGGLFVVPKKQVYGATKSFIRYFTKCMQLELGNTNVRMSLLSPGGINTKPELLVLNHALKGISKATILEPEQVAKTAINGMLKGKKEIVPGLLNKILVLLNGLLPAFVQQLIIKKQLRVALKE